MKILLAHPAADLYGSDRMAVLAVCAMVNRGHTVTVVLPTDGPLHDRMRNAGAQVWVVATPVLRKANLSLLGCIAMAWQVLTSGHRVAAAIRAAAPDVVYVNTIVQPWWILAARRRRLRVVVHVREAESQISARVARIIHLPLLMADVVLCNSRATKSCVTSALPSLNDRTSVVYNGKDWSTYRRKGPVRESELVRCSVIGRLSPRKGQDIAIRAVAALIAKDINLTLTLVGTVFPGYEWYERKLRRTVDELGIAGRVTFIGFQEDIRPVLGCTDIAIVPSRVEPFGTVAAECMAAGVVTIVADVQGLTEIVSDGRNGLTFRSEDHRDLARCCEWAIRHRDQARLLAESGSRDVPRRFSLERYERAVISALESTQRITA